MLRALDVALVDIDGPEHLADAIDADRQDHERDALVEPGQVTEHQARIAADGTVDTSAGPYAVTPGSNIFINVPVSPFFKKQTTGNSPVFGETPNVYGYTPIEPAGKFVAPYQCPPPETPADMWDLRYPGSRFQTVGATDQNPWNMKPDDLRDATISNVVKYSGLTTGGEPGNIEANDYPWPPQGDTNHSGWTNPYSAGYANLVDLTPPSLPAVDTTGDFLEFINPAVYTDDTLREGRAYGPATGYKIYNVKYHTNAGAPKETTFVLGGLVASHTVAGDPQKLEATTRFGPGSFSGGGESGDAYDAAVDPANPGGLARFPSDQEFRYRGEFVPKPYVAYGITKFESDGRVEVDNPADLADHVGKTFTASATLDGTVFYQITDAVLAVGPAGKMVLTGGGVDALPVPTTDLNNGSYKFLLNGWSVSGGPSAPDEVLLELPSEDPQVGDFWTIKGQVGAGGASPWPGGLQSTGRHASSWFIPAVFGFCCVAAQPARG